MVHFTYIATHLCSMGSSAPLCKYHSRSEVCPALTVLSQAPLMTPTMSCSQSLLCYITAECTLTGPSCSCSTMKMLIKHASACGLDMPDSEASAQRSLQCCMVLTREGCLAPTSDTDAGMVHGALCSQYAKAAQYLREMSLAVMGTAVPPPPHELHAISPRPLQVAQPTSESDHLWQIHGTRPAGNSASVIHLSAQGVWGACMDK